MPSSGAGGAQSMASASGGGGASGADGAASSCVRAIAAPSPSNGGQDDEVSRLHARLARVQQCSAKLQGQDNDTLWKLARHKPQTSRLIYRRVDSDYPFITRCFSENKGRLTMTPTRVADSGATDESGLEHVSKAGTEASNPRCVQS